MRYGAQSKPRSLGDAFAYSLQSAADNGVRRVSRGSSATFSTSEKHEVGFAQLARHMVLIGVVSAQSYRLSRASGSGFALDDTSM